MCWMKLSSKPRLIILDTYRDTDKSYTLIHMEMAWKLRKTTHITCLIFFRISNGIFTSKLVQWWFVVLRIFSMPSFERNTFLSIRHIELYDAFRDNKSISWHEYTCYRYLLRDYFWLQDFIQNIDNFIILFIELNNVY